MPATEQFAIWLDRQLAERRWDVPVLAKQTGISPSIIYRWRKGYQPGVDNCRRLAHALTAPLLHVLTAAQVLTREEAQVTSTAERDIGDFDTVELARELYRRTDYEHRQRAQPPQSDPDTLAWQDTHAPRPRHRPATDQYLQSVPTGADAPPSIVTDSAGNRYELHPLPGKSQEQEHPE